jgi:hypothetical protein
LSTFIVEQLALLSPGDKDNQHQLQNYTAPPLKKGIFTYNPDLHNHMEEQTKFLKKKIF